MLNHSCLLRLSERSVIVIRSVYYLEINTNNFKLFSYWIFITFVLSVCLLSKASPLYVFALQVEESRGFWKIGSRLTCINSTWSAANNDDTCWDGTKIVNNFKTVVEMSDDGIGSNFTTSKNKTNFMMILNI